MSNDMRPMSARDLADYGLVSVATVHIDNGKSKIAITDSSIAELEKCVYAFLIGDEVVRIGSSKARLKKRFKSWEHDITNALCGQKSPTSLKEAEDWHDALKQHGHGVIFARQGTLVSTPVGTFRAYLDEESLLIGRHLPRLNNSKHR